MNLISIVYLRYLESVILYIISYHEIIFSGGESINNIIYAFCYEMVTVYILSEYKLSYSLLDFNHGLAVQ